MYNLWGMYIHMTEDGIVIEAKDKDVTINNADKVTINAKTEVVLNTPILKVSGDVIDNYESNPSTLKALRTVTTRTITMWKMWNRAVPPKPVIRLRRKSDV